MLVANFTSRIPNMGEQCCPYKIPQIAGSPATNFKDNQQQNNYLN